MARSSFSIDDQKRFSLFSFGCDFLQLHSMRRSGGRRHFLCLIVICAIYCIWLRCCGLNYLNILVYTFSRCLVARRPSANCSIGKNGMENALSALDNRQVPSQSVFNQKQTTNYLFSYYQDRGACEAIWNSLLALATNLRWFLSSWLLTLTPIPTYGTPCILA